MYSIFLYNLHKLVSVQLFRYNRDPIPRKNKEKGNVWEHRTGQDIEEWVKGKAKGEMGWKKVFVEMGILRRREKARDSVIVWETEKNKI